MRLSDWSGVNAIDKDRFTVLPHSIAVTETRHSPDDSMFPSCLRIARYGGSGTLLLDEVHQRCVVAGSWAALVGLGGVGWLGNTSFVVYVG